MKAYVSGFKPLPEHFIEIAYHSAWSIQSMAAYGMETCRATYIGSVEKADGHIMDYLQDDSGGWWFDNRFRERTGEIISMDRKLFGHDLSERNRRTWRKRTIYQLTTK